MRVNKFLNMAVLLAVLLHVASCKKDLGSINVDPSRPDRNALKTRFLLANAQQSIATVVFSNNSANFYTQYLSEGPYPGASLYSVKNFDWAAFYTGPLYDLEQIIKFVDEGSAQADESNGSSANQKAVAQILKSFFYVHMTDRWGPIPFESSLKGTDDLKPAYTDQKAVYTEVFKTLTEAVNAIKTDEAGVAGDLLLHGDMEMWQKFANMLRLQMALNLSKADPAMGKTEFEAALNAPGGVIESNSENMEWHYIDDPNYLNPWYNNYTISNRNDYAISNTLEEYMNATNDDRISVYAEELPGINPYRGLQYGSAAAKNIPNIYSRIGDAFRDKTSGARVFNYAQELFMKAEAIKRGWITGAAAVTYGEANKASWEMNGVYDAVAFSLYSADPEILYTDASGIEKIITQKWVHNYLNGYYAWNDLRRTGFPVLEPAVDAIDERGIPLRQGYPVNEVSLNKESYDAGVTILGGVDDNYTSLWLYK